MQSINQKNVVNTSNDNGECEENKEEGQELSISCNKVRHEEKNSLCFVIEHLRLFISFSMHLLKIHFENHHRFPKYLLP